MTNDAKSHLIYGWDELNHSPVIYPIAAIKDSENPEAATELIEFLTTPEAQNIFQEYGFDRVNEKGN